MAQWFKKSVEEVRAALAQPTTLVMFACKKGAAERMPTSPENYRFPGKRTPILRGHVEEMSRDGARVRVVDEMEGGGWVAFEDVLFNIDVL